MTQRELERYCATWMRRLKLRDPWSIEVRLVPDSEIDGEWGRYEWINDFGFLLKIADATTKDPARLRHTVVHEMLHIHMRSWPTKAYYCKAREDSIDVLAEIICSAYPARSRTAKDTENAESKKTPATATPCPNGTD